jgi:orotate phosphoribosyltransferase
MTLVLAAAARNTKNAAVKRLSQEDRVDLVSALIDTEALQVAPAGQVFWYTSGTVGPYYINTHYLFGGAEAAAELLEFIDRDKEGRDVFPAALLERVRQQYESVEVYAAVVDALVEAARDRGGIELVSGGERRDWFFSPMVAQLLDVPHLLLYKDLQGRLFDGASTRDVQDMSGLKICHVADLVTEASSYIKSWIPALERAGGKIDVALNVVDRAQGGMDVLGQAGLAAEALVRVDGELFGHLEAKGRIDHEQRQGLDAYFADPHAAMRAFLADNEDFVQKALNGDERTAARARTLIETNPYGLDWSF